MTFLHPHYMHYWLSRDMCLFSAMNISCSKTNINQSMTNNPQLIEHTIKKILKCLQNSIVHMADEKEEKITLETEQDLAVQFE